MMHRLQRCWRERGSFLATLDRLPRTLCHGDAFPANIFLTRTATEHESLVAVDWSEVGIGPVGEEIATLVLISSPFDTYSFPPDELDGPVFAAYVRGLNDAGWQGDERLVRLGYVGAATTRKALLDPAIFFLQIAGGSLTSAGERRGMASVKRLLEHEATAFSFALDRADEARELMRAS